MHENNPLSIETKRWEFGLHFGEALTLGNKSASILADNSAFLVSDPGLLGED